MTPTELADEIEALAVETWPGANIVRTGAHEQLVKKLTDNIHVICAALRPKPAPDGEVETLLRASGNSVYAHNSDEARLMLHAADTIRDLRSRIAEVERERDEANTKADKSWLAFQDASVRADNQTLLVTAAQAALLASQAEVARVTISRDAWRKKCMDSFVAVVKAADAAVTESEDDKRSRIIRERAAEIARDYEP